jgi:hypothetical protein
MVIFTRIALGSSLHSYSGLDADADADPYQDPDLYKIREHLPLKNHNLFVKFGSKRELDKKEICDQ